MSLPNHLTLAPRDAAAALDAFGARYGRPSMLLLMHAAVPETLRPELLALLRANFLPARRHEAYLDADVLFGPVTTELGGGYFRIDPQVRWHALVMLRGLSHGEPRLRQRRVAELLWRWIERTEPQAARRGDRALAEYLEVQRWVALAYLDSEAAATAFAQAMKRVTEGGTPLAAAARLKLGGLAAAIEIPLAGEAALLAYARGVDALAQGDEAAAREHLQGLEDEAPSVGGVSLRPARELLAPTTGEAESAGSSAPSAETSPTWSAAFDRVAAEPSHDHDVFISYAPADDQSVLEQAGWVTTLHTALGASLAQRLGRDVSIWRSTASISGGKLSAGTKRILERSAVFLAVVSPAYLRSPEAQRELQYFCAGAKRQLRVFKVEKFPVEGDEHQPPELQNAPGVRLVTQGPSSREEEGLDPHDAEDVAKYSLMRSLDPREKSDRKKYLREVGKLATAIAVSLGQRPGDPKTDLRVDADPEPVTAGFRWPPVLGFMAVIKAKRDGFTGRAWIFDAIERWLERRRPAGLLVVGEAGIGKTALIAELAARRTDRELAAVHFCRFDDNKTLSPGTFVGSIATQLAAALPAYKRLVEADVQGQTALDQSWLNPGRALELGILKPIKRISPAPESVLLIVDGLDEALKVSSDESLVSLLSSQLGRFPKNVRLIMTSRPSEAVVAALQSWCQILEIDASGAQALADCRQFVLGRAQQDPLAQRLGKHGWSRERLAVAIEALCAGNLLLANRMLHDLESGTLSFEDLDSTAPSGLSSYYERLLDRAFSEGAYEEAQRVLGLIAASPAPIPITELAAILGIDQSAVEAILRQLSPVLVQIDDGVALAHASFEQWLTEQGENGKPRAGRYAIDLSASRAAIDTWRSSQAKPDQPDRFGTRPPWREAAVADAEGRRTRPPPTDAKGEGAPDSPAHREGPKRQFGLRDLTVRRIRMKTAYRLNPSRLPTVGLFDSVVDPADMEALFAVEALTNPRIRDEVGQLSLVPPEERIAGAGSSLIMTAFTHLNPMGSRFSDGSYGVFYACGTLEGAIASVSHHSAMFLARVAEPAVDVDMRVIKVEIDADLVDLREPRYQREFDLFNLDSYAAAQALGRELRDAGHWGVIYPNTRLPNDDAVAIFRPRALRNARPSGHIVLHWDGEGITHWSKRNSRSQLN
jgi:hypothetical protein